MFKKACCVFFATLILTLPVSAQDMESRMKRMEEMLLKLQTELKEKDKKISDLEKKVSKSAAPKNDVQLMNELTADNHEKSVKFVKGDHSGHDHNDTSKFNLQNVNTFMDTLNISTILNVTAGTSSVRDEQLENFQGGAHDPNERGFSLQQLELGLSGNVDNLFDANAFILFTEDDVEIEEAYVTTRSLPHQLQLKAGFYLTEFGIYNQEHAHTQSFIDQPLINTRIFGGEGMRDAGVRLSWLAPLPWYSELLLGVQNSDGDYMSSFRGSEHSHGEDEHEEEEDERFEEGIGHRPYVGKDTRSMEDFVWSGRWVNSFAPSKDATVQLGLSGLFGDNHTGGQTYVYGADFKMILEDEKTGKADWTFQGEIMKRTYKADSIDVPAEGMATAFSHDSADLDDWGFYVQGLKSLDDKWSIGLRYEYVTGSGDSYEGEEVVDRDDDFNRSDRFRVSPLLVYQHSEFTKLRLQYNFDSSDTDDDASTLWLGLEVLLGSHPAHKF
ncbi:MAG: TonB-dependent receptor [Lentisphaeraceae bacterium]|nr:TonB-dependent receptor [Lentisphaeraceae bacterium]